MTETTVIKAFLKREHANLGGFSSDGICLRSDNADIATWDQGRIKILPQNGDMVRKKQRNMLVELVLWELQKGDVLSQVINPIQRAPE